MGIFIACGGSVGRIIISLLVRMSSVMLAGVDRGGGGCAI